MMSKLLLALALVVGMGGTAGAQHIVWDTGYRPFGYGQGLYYGYGSYYGSRHNPTAARSYRGRHSVTRHPRAPRGYPAYCYGRYSY